jgi:hypothetical protein
MLDYGLILSLVLLTAVGTFSALHGYLASSAFDPLQQSLEHSFLAGDSGAP